jgi:predicted DNA-binding protein
MAQITLNTRISPELHTLLEEHSKKTGTSKAQIIAMALKEYFDKSEKNN